MTDLVRPDVRHHACWAATVADFADPDAMHGSGTFRMTGPLDTSRAGCASFVDAVLGEDVPDPGDGLVRCSYSWITDGTPGSGAGAVIGFLALRHRLNAFLLDQGGHIGYSVRPSRRREGHASRALALGVRRAAGLGLDRVLVTCDHDNDPSRRTIERNGGVLEDRRGDKLRFWIATA